MGQSEHRPCRSEPCPAAVCVDMRGKLLTVRDARADCAAALECLAEACLPEVHAAVRAQGYRGADAEDLSQAYFAHFLERGDFEYAASWEGCLGTFLRVSVRHFLSNVRSRARARKRGGGRRPLPLAASRERRAAWEPVDAVTPESLLAQRQAEATLDEALHALRAEMERAGGLARFSRVESFLLAEVDNGGYRRVAREWGVGESAVRVTVHRLRRRLAVLLRRSLAAQPDRASVGAS